MGPFGASCFNTISTNTRDIEKSAWDEERVGMLCAKSEVFTDWKKVILKLCKVTKRCSYDTKKKVVRFERNVKNFVYASSDRKMVDFSEYTVDMFDEQVDNVEIDDLNIEGEL